MDMTQFVAKMLGLNRQIAELTAQLKEIEKMHQDTEFMLDILDKALEDAPIGVDDTEWYIQTSDKAAKLRAEAEKLCKTRMELTARLDEIKAVFQR